jgi:excisionase family DNA binding protein
LTPLHTTRLSYSINETVELTGLARSSIYRAIAARMLRARKCGRRTIILGSDLHKFLASLKEVA